MITVLDSLRQVVNYKEKAASELGNLLSGFIESECWTLFNGTNMEDLQSVFVYLYQNVKQIASVQEATNAKQAL